ncbi:sodium-dependent bicarbonate transport family permease [Wenzhouxiangella sp. XN79A]|uniref:sodium-dependent bicarbonate transport family permease n=1 Tax=Wenzhouxiangella sp. XN79A TaxID=2724193 RepID=UPI00144A7538|nr:sodium-dependent bicarbonate transport family permease [Wenzhouxiangella sp. XN79A]NKI34802.1 sodium-dependent bicarbonate transport family permease [Wenzhouxiangella sp. XN79A]
MDPILLFFLFGLAAGLLRAELRLPSAIYDFVSMLLLLSIGLKGGVELAEQPFLSVLPDVLVAIVMGIVLPLLIYPVLRHVGRFKRPDAASIAAHYGSVSVGTFAVAVAWLATREIDYEAHLPLLLVVLEMPAILVGIVLARGFSAKMDWTSIGHEVFLGKGVVLLLGGLLIGWIAGPEGVEPIGPLFFDLFKGILAVFLLEMGLIAAAQASSLKRHGLFLLPFGTLVPILFGSIGTGLGMLMGMSTGGTMLFAVLAASASYIAVPAAMRISVPQANPTLSLTASLGITFPFNVLVGIPLYWKFAEWAHGAG